MLALWLTIVATDAWGDNVTYSYKGVRYTYLSSDNYTSYFNTSVHTPEDYGWYPDDDGWYVNAEKDYITMAEADPDGRYSAPKMSSRRQHLRRADEDLTHPSPFRRAKMTK
jgi:hypothetical protein